MTDLLSALGDFLGVPPTDPLAGAQAVLAAAAEEFIRAYDVDPVGPATDRQRRALEAAALLFTAATLQEAVLALPRRRG